VGAAAAEEGAQVREAEAILAELDGLAVGVAGEEDHGEDGPGRHPPVLGHPGLQVGEGRLHDRERLAREELDVVGREAPELHEHPPEADGVGLGVAERLSLAGADVVADDQGQPPLAEERSLGNGARYALCRWFMLPRIGPRRLNGRSGRTRLLTRASPQKHEAHQRRAQPEDQKRSALPQSLQTHASIMPTFPHRRDRSSAPGDAASRRRPQASSSVTGPCT
jgi:hypothetical protein